MTINYKDADSRVIELEVTDEVGSFYLASLEEEKSNERRETRRHTPLSEFAYEDAHYFDSGADTEGQALTRVAVQRALAGLAERQRRLVVAVHFAGCSCAELAKAEGKHRSTIAREVNAATAEFRRLYRAE
jgi:RNA polymerase sigma-70 factor (ECF subfamily)